jgi:hypothetical protein
MKLPPIMIQGVPCCPHFYIRTQAQGHSKPQRLVFGMRSDGEFPNNKPQKRKYFTLVRPIIAPKACNVDGCGYWWPAFSFTPQAATM